MKRYVVEFANDNIKKYREYKEHWAEKKVENITKIVSNCERGLITDTEAVLCIVKEIYG